jgi:hypothetical protein
VWRLVSAPPAQSTLTLIGDSGARQSVGVGQSISKLGRRGGTPHGHYARHALIASFQKSWQRLPWHPRRLLHRNLSLPPWNRRSDASSANRRTTAWRIKQALLRVHWQRCTTTPTAKMKFQKSCAGKKMLAQSAGSLRPPRWARGPLLVPCRLGTPRTSFKSRQRVGV